MFCRGEVAGGGAWSGHSALLREWRTARLVILLGPPASGKTALGRMLGERGWRFREWELELLDTWGNRENLVAHKTEALAALHERVRDLAAAPGLPAVYETTGLSDAEFLDQVVTELPTIVVKLDVGLNEARRHRVDSGRVVNTWPTTMRRHAASGTNSRRARRVRSTWSSTRRRSGSTAPLSL